MKEIEDREMHPPALYFFSFASLLSFTSFISSLLFAIIRDGLSDGLL